MESNKFTNVVLVIIGLLLAGILVVLFIGNKSKPNQYEGAFDTIPEATLNQQQTPNQVQGVNTQNPVQPTTQAQPTPSTAVTLDMSSPYAQTYQTLFTNELAKAVNYNGHYRLVNVGCGSGCMNFFALDKSTGKVLKVPEEYKGQEESQNIADYYFAADSGNLVIQTNTFRYEYGIVNGQFKLLSAH